MKKCQKVSLLVALLFLAASGCAGAVRDMELAEPGYAPASGIVEEAPGESGYFADEVSQEQQVTSERLVIRTADLDLIVPDTEEALAQIRDLVEGLDGYVVSLNTYQFEGGITGSATLRVPAESFDQAVDQLKELATTVRRESISGQDVTDEYVDLESRLRHLRAKEEQLLQFLDNAEDTEAVLAVYEQLSATQQEIEQVTGRMQYLENQAALATIVVDLTPDALAQPLEVSGWNLPGTVRNAIEALLAVIEFVVKAAIYLILVILPTLLIIAIPIVGLVFLIRWVVKRRRRR